MLFRSPKDARRTEAEGSSQLNRKNSDASTLHERKNSLDTSSMAFNQDEEMKDSVRGTDMESSMMMDEGRFLREQQLRASPTGLVIDLDTLRTLLNRKNCEFLLSLVLGAPKPEKSAEKDS